MARRYGINGNVISTASATLPLGNIVSATTVRPMVTDIIVGFDPTPADLAFDMAMQRGTTAGTWAGAGGAAITPQALDSGDPAALATGNQGVCSVGPTLTASAFLLKWSMNQRATFRWVAAPGFELKLPAAVNSLNLMSLVAGGAPNASFSFLYEE